MKRIIYVKYCRMIRKIWYHFHCIIYHSKIIREIKKDGIAYNPPFDSGIRANNICPLCGKSYGEIYNDYKKMLKKLK